MLITHHAKESLSDIAGSLPAVPARGVPTRLRLPCLFRARVAVSPTAHNSTARVLNN